MTDLHSKILDAPPLGQFFFIFLQFSRKFGSITSNHRQTGVNFVVLVNRSQTSRVKCWTANFCDIASEGPDIIMHN